MRRPALQPLLAAVLVLVVAAPVSAVQPGGADLETLSGTLEALVVEHFAEGRSAEEFDLRSDTGRVTQLRFLRGDAEGLAGALVEVTGRRVGRALEVPSAVPGAGGLRVRSLPPAPETGSWAALDGSGTTSDGGATYGTTGTTATVRNVAVILLNFTDLKTQPWTKATVQDAVTGSGTSLRAFYEEESKGALSITASVFGWFTIPAATTGCDWRTWHTLGLDAAAGAGIDLTPFTNVMFIWPKTDQCGFAGIAYVPGRHSYINGTLNGQVLTHEFGHNLGISHSNARECTVNGTRVWLSADADCTVRVYADPFSTMGNNAYRHNHASHLGELGWLAPSEKVAGTAGATYTISPYFGAGPVKLVRIPRGDGSFFALEVRTPYGAFDTYAAGSPVTVGATIRIVTGTGDPTGSPKMTELLDTVPSTTDLKDAPLTVGRTVTDPVSHISFTTLSADATGISVRVRESVAPASPGGLTATATDAPSVVLAWTAGSDNVAVAGYRVTRGGTTVATLPAGATGWTDTKVATGTAYGYGVATVDTSGNVSTAATATVTTPGAPSPTPSPTASPSPAPSASASPSPSPSSDTSGTATLDTKPPTATAWLNTRAGYVSVSVTWGAATDDRGVVAYRVYRGSTLIATLPADARSYRDTGRAQGTTYGYGVRAVDAAGNAGPQRTMSATTLVDTTRPTAPRNFHVVARSGGYVTFAWSASTDNVGIARYALFRYGYTSVKRYVYGTRVRLWVPRYARYYVRAIDVSGLRSYKSAIVRGR